MTEHHLYLIINLGSILVPLVASFYPKAPFFKEWKWALPGIAVAGFLFIVWDVWFTKIGIWGFNDQYTTGFKWLGLPIEEWLFFLCIPYACLFTYFALNHLKGNGFFADYHKECTALLAIIFGWIGVIYADKMYTAFTFIGLTALLCVHLIWIKKHYIGNFYRSFLVILLPFSITNGLLTGSFIPGEVVWYNNNENMAQRLGTIPFEDAFYGMFLLLLATTIYEELKQRKGN